MLLEIELDDVHHLYGDVTNFAKRMLWILRGSLPQKLIEGLSAPPCLAVGPRAARRGSAHAIGDCLAHSMVSFDLNLSLVSAAIGTPIALEVDERTETSDLCLRRGHSPPTNRLNH